MLETAHQVRVLGLVQPERASQGIEHDPGYAGLPARTASARYGEYAESPPSSLRSCGMSPTLGGSEPDGWPCPAHVRRGGGRETRSTGPGPLAVVILVSDQAAMIHGATWTSTVNLSDQARMRPDRVSCVQRARGQPSEVERPSRCLGGTHTGFIRARAACVGLAVALAPAGSSGLQRAARIRIRGANRRVECSVHEPAAGLG